MNYLTSGELAELVGCQPRSFACMRRWLAKNGWPFETSITGLPRVSRAYHDARMAGAAQASTQDAPVEPDFSRFQ